MYCSICGSDLNVKEIKNEGAIPYCVSCDKLFFPKVTLAMISILVNSNNQICLVNQRHKKEYKVLLAGFVKPKETLFS